MLSVINRWNADRRQDRLAALDFIACYGAEAYGVARRLARAERFAELPDPQLSRGHWERVRREVKQLEGRL